jgi:hypothetical protein
MVGAWLSSMAGMNLDSQLGQGGPLKEITVPLTDPVEGT